MPLDMSWWTALMLVLDGFCLGIGWIVAQAIYSAILGVLGRGRAP